MTAVLSPRNKEDPAKEATASVRIGEWRPRRSAQLLETIALPLIRLLNKPSMNWAARALLDLAHRANGIAITQTVHGGLTRAEIRFLDRIKDRLQNGVLIDIGAHAGTYALHLRKLAPASTIYAFEPHPRTFQRMLRHIEGKRIHAVGAAVANEAGRMKLHDFGDGSTQASLDHDAVAMFSPDIASHDVDVVTLDGFMTEKGIDRIAFLKIDTEGFDLDVLKGARRALAEQRIGLIQFEFVAANVSRRVFVRDFFDVLQGYHIHRLMIDGDLLPLRYDVKQEIFVTQNFIATPRLGV